MDVGHLSKDFLKALKAGKMRSTTFTKLVEENPVPYWL